MKLEELIEIFKKCIASSKIQPRNVAARDEIIKNIVNILDEAITSNDEKKQERFWGFENLRFTYDFNVGLDTVSEANHSLYFNEGFINVLLASDLTHCPGFIVAHAGQFLQYYGVDHILRNAFLNKLQSYYRSPTLTPLQRLYAYRTVLIFTIKSDNTTELSGLTLKQVHDDAEKILKSLPKEVTEKSSEIKLLARFVLALAKLKKSDKSLDPEAVALLKQNEESGHKPSKYQLAIMHAQGRTNIPQENATSEAIRLYKELSNTDAIVGAKVNLALLHHKHLTGENETTDNAQKIKLCREAARLGCLPGIHNLAVFRTQEDSIEARKLFELAIGKGYPSSQKGLDALLNKDNAAATSASSSTMGSTAQILVTTQISSTTTKSPKRGNVLPRGASDPSAATSSSDFNSSSLATNTSASSTSTSATKKRPAEQQKVTVIPDDDSDDDSIDLSKPSKSKKTEENYSAKVFSTKR